MDYYRTSLQIIPNICYQMILTFNAFCSKNKIYDSNLKLIDFTEFALVFS